MKHFFLTVFVLTICAFVATGQESNVDPFKMEVEFYDVKGSEDRLEFSDKKGNTFRINKTPNSRGLYIKNNGNWVKHGVWYDLSDGIITKKTIFDFGKKNGLCVSYRKENGKPRRESPYVNNVLEGTVIDYRSNGRVSQKCDYVGGKRNGKCTNYREDGSIVTTQEYKNNKWHGMRIYYNSKGEAKSKDYYQNGKKVN